MIAGAITGEDMIGSELELRYQPLGKVLVGEREPAAKEGGAMVATAPPN